MAEQNQKQLGNILWSIATDHLWGGMSADHYRRDPTDVMSDARYLSGRGHE